MSDTKALEDGGGVDSAEDVATDPNINPTALPLPLPPVPVLALVLVLVIVLPPVVTIRDGAVNVKPLIGATKAPAPPENTGTDTELFTLPTPTPTPTPPNVKPPLPIPLTLLSTTLLEDARVEAEPALQTGA